MQCDYYDSGRCRSCTLIETPYPDQLAGKDAQARAVVHAAARAGDLHWLDPIGSAESGFRNKAKMVVGGTVDAPTLGILGPGGQGVDLRWCGLHEAPIVSALAHLAPFITTAGLTPYDVGSRRGELKYVLVTASPAGELMVRFVLRSREALPRIRKHLPGLLAALPHLVVVSVNLQPAPAAVIEGDQEIVLTEARTLPIRLGEVVLQLRPQSFFQTNTALAAALYRESVAWVEPLSPRSIWDLYCGVGGFALHLAAPGRTVTGIEISAPAIASAQSSAASLAHRPADAALQASARPADPALQASARTEVRFAVGDSTQFAINSGDAPDLVVVNPPRRGIGSELAEWLETSDARHVLYSSCDVDSLAKDLAAMDSLRPVRARVLDMFPQSRHFETLVLLERG